MTNDCNAGETPEILEMINNLTLKSNGTIRYKIIACSSDSCKLVRTVYFKPDSDHIVKCNGKSYAKFRICKKDKNTDTKNCGSKIDYAYISTLVEMSEGHVEIPVGSDKLDSFLSKAAANGMKSTVYVKQNCAECKKIKFVGIQFPAPTSQSPDHTSN